MKYLIFVSATHTFSLVYATGWYGEREVLIMLVLVLYLTKICIAH